MRIVKILGKKVIRKQGLTNAQNNNSLHMRCYEIADGMPLIRKKALYSFKVVSAHNI